MKMNSIQKMMVFLAVFMAGCGVVFAQPAAPAEANSPTCQGKFMHAHRHGHWWMRELSEKLNLTDAQKAAIKPIFAADANAIKAVRQDNSLSKEQKMTQIKEIRQNGMSQINAILTPAQQTEFATLKEQMRHRMHHRVKDPNAVLTFLTGKLNLTDAEKTAILPILVADANAIKAVWQDISLTKEQKMAQIKAIRQNGKEQINALLTPEQQAKWAELKKQSPWMRHKRMCPSSGQQGKPADSNT